MKPVNCGPIFFGLIVILTCLITASIQQAGPSTLVIEPEKICKFHSLGDRPKPDDKKRKKRTPETPPEKDTFILTDLFKTPGTMEKMVEAYKQATSEKHGLTFCSLRKLAEKASLPKAAKDLMWAVDPLIKFLQNREIGPVDLEKAHFIGEGVGAHIWGQVGRKLWDKEKKKIGRITGLDPMGVCFDPNVADRCRGEAYPKNILSKTDAKFVDVLFTGREYWSFCQLEIMGSDADMCHACFLVNGGFRQPGCGGRDSQNFGSACSHWRAAELYLESLENPEAFNATACRTEDDDFLNVCERSFATYNKDLDPETRGIFGFATNGESPYSVPLVCWVESATDDGKVQYPDCYIESHW